MVSGVHGGGKLRRLAIGADMPLSSRIKSQVPGRAWRRSDLAVVKKVIVCWGCRFPIAGTLDKLSCGASLNTLIDVCEAHTDWCLTCRQLRRHPVNSHKYINKALVMNTGRQSDL